MTAPDLFDPAVLQVWAQRASADALVQRQSVLAQLRLGLRNSESGKQAWLEIAETGVHAGVGGDTVNFYLEGAQDAFDDLGRGFPFNRLVRQHRLTVGGDLRACVQNWLLLYAPTYLTATLEI